jgi:hypothetical protein
MLLCWYPQPYFRAAGGAKLLLLLIGVDIVIGPLLTLIVFNPAKKRLAFDLCAIATLQLCALSYGCWVMFNARPVYLAFAGDRFELVTAGEIDDNDLDQATPGYRQLPLTGPKVVGTQLPGDVFQRDQLARSALMGGSIGLYPQYYVPYTAVARRAVAKSQPLSMLRERNPQSAAMIDTVIAAPGGSTLRFLPLQGRHGDMAVVMDDKRGEIKGVLPVDPW